MTRNNTVNKIHVSAAEAEYKMYRPILERQPRKRPCQTLCSSKVNRKNRSLEVDKGTYTSVHSPIVGDANGYYVFILLRYAKRARSRRRYLVWMR